MKTRFSQLQDEIGCKNVWLSKMLDITPEHISTLRSGKAPMRRVTEVAMMALASGWRP